MEHTRFHNHPCPTARALDCVGDWWSILILRDAFRGLSRFDEFQKSLGIAPNILTRRLAHLCERGVLEKRPYQTRPVRHGYHLTGMGSSFFPVLIALASWGMQHIPPNGPEWRVVDRASGAAVDAIIINAATGQPLTPDRVAVQFPAEADSSLCVEEPSP